MYSAGPSELAKPNLHFTIGDKPNVYLAMYNKFYSRDYYWTSNNTPSPALPCSTDIYTEISSEQITSYRAFVFFF